jgi:RNA polymerase sigma-70 factor (ECF subfamily)
MDRGASERLTADAFALCFQTHARVLWTVAAGVLGEPTEAEDVLQEAAAMALEKLEQFDPRTSFVAWMSAFVRNVALNQARKRERRATRPMDPAALPEGPPAGGSTCSNGHPPAARLPIDARGVLAIDQESFDDAVLAALRELSCEARSALLLRVVLDLSYREIATVLGMPEGTAMSHVHRSRLVLRELLSGAGTTRAAAGLSAEEAR